MSTKRDLVEAYSFTRRRLVTAFVSGAPGGREVEPVRPARSIVGGLALAVLLVAGAAIAGHFRPTVPANWGQPGMFISKSTGQGYVIVAEGSDLQPVLNATSAKLIFGEDLAPETVKQEAIDAEEIGERIGIFGAPESLPSPDLLVDTGWTACTNAERGVHLRIDDRTDAEPVSGGAVVVEAQGRSFLLAGREGDVRRLLLPADAPSRGRVLTQLGIGSAGVVPVSAEWVGLFPEGTPLTLEAFGPLGSGMLDYGEQQVAAGELVSVNDVVYLAREGSAMQLDDFSLAVYRGLRNTGAEPTPLDGLEAAGKDPVDWPDAAPAPVEGEACAVLHARHGEAATVTLAAPGEQTTAAALGGRVATTVRPGRGAYVLTAGWGDTGGGTPWVVDSTGRRYRLGGPAGEAAGKLGYGAHPAPTIPDAWIEPIRECGPELSVAAAMAPPAEPADGGGPDLCA